MSREYVIIMSGLELTQDYFLKNSDVLLGQMSSELMLINSVVKGAQNYWISCQKKELRIIESSVKEFRIIVSAVKWAQGEKSGQVSSVLVIIEAKDNQVRSQSTSELSDFD